MKYFIGWFVVSRRPPQRAIMSQSAEGLVLEPYVPSSGSHQIWLCPPRGPSQSRLSFSVSRHLSLLNAAFLLLAAAVRRRQLIVADAVLNACACVNTKLGNYRGNEMCLFKLSAELWCWPLLTCTVGLVWWGMAVKSHRVTAKWESSQSESTSPCVCLTPLQIE